MASEKETKKFVSDDGVSHAATPEKAEGGEAEIDPKKVKKVDGEGIKKRTDPIKESIMSIFEDELSEDLKNQIAAAFEVAVETRAEEIAEEKVREEVEAIKEEIQQTSRDLVEEANDSAEELLESISKYLDYVAEEFMTENEIGIESALAVEKANRLIEGLQSVMMEAKIEVTEESIDLVSELEDKLEESYSKVNYLTTERFALAEEIEALKREAFITEASRSLTQSQAETLKELSEKFEFKNDEQFKSDVLSLKDRMFNTKPNIGDNIVEEFDNGASEENKDIVESKSPSEVDLIIAAINKNLANKKY